MLAHQCGQRVKVEECEKIDRTELAIDCGRPTDFRTYGQIRAQQF
jgi:hypothetical protein